MWLKVYIPGANSVILSKNANFVKNINNGIPKSVSQGEHRTLSEADSRVEEISSAIKRISQEAIRDAQTTERTAPGAEQREIEDIDL